MNFNLFILVILQYVCVCVQERVCEDSASFDLTSGDLAQCIADIQHILAVKKDQLSQEGEEGGSEWVGLDGRG